MKIVEIATGKVYPLELPENLPGNFGTFEMWDNRTIMVHMCATNITQDEIDAFMEEPLKLWYLGIPSNGFNALYIDCCLGLIENVFNPKLYKDNRIELFLASSNTPLFFVLIEYETKVVRAIKLFNMKHRNPTVRRLKNIWENTLYSTMTDEEYRNWFESNVLTKELSQMTQIMKPLGVINLDGVVEKLVFLKDD